MKNIAMTTDDSFGIGTGCAVAAPSTATKDTDVVNVYATVVMATKMPFIGRC